MPSPEHDAVVAMLRQGNLFATSGTSIDVAASRLAMDAMTATAVVPEGTRREPVDAAGVPAEWLSGPGADTSRVLLYLHGGGYILGSIRTHRAIAARIAAAAGIRALIIDYRLAPEHPHPAAVEDAVAAYAFLLRSGIAPERIAIGGDSAGGGLTLATLLALKAGTRPLPGAAFGLSPWTDLTCSGDSMLSRAAADPMVQPGNIAATAALYVASGDPHAPTVSPLFATKTQLSGLPPIAIQVGTAETLLDDAARMADRLRDAGVDVEYEAWPELIHVFQAMAPHVPEANEAIAKLGDFLKRRL